MIINLLYIGYRCVLLIYFSIFTEYITFWLALQSINSLIVKCMMVDYNDGLDEDDERKISFSQNNSYHLRQNISVIYLYIDNICLLYTPSDTTITDKTKRLIKYITFHLGLILLLLKIKLNIMKSRLNTERQEKCKQEIDIVVNELMECLNTEFVNYNNQGHVNCPHFTDSHHEQKVEEYLYEANESKDVDFNLKAILVSTDKFVQSLNIILASIYMMMHYVFWNELTGLYRVMSVLSPLLIILALVIYGPSLYPDVLTECPENWHNYLWFPQHTSFCDNMFCACWCNYYHYYHNTMRITCDTFYRIYTCIRYLDNLNSFLCPGNWTRGYLSPYQQSLVLNFELFLPIYFCWHTISSAFNDNFTISRIIINYLYGATQFILDHPSDLNAPGDRVKQLYTNQIIPFAQVYDELCNEYEIA